MNFVNYFSAPFADISNTPKVILATGSNTLWVDSLLVCNKSNVPIRFNLKKLRLQNIPVEIFYINELEIKPYSSIDVVKELGAKIFLQMQLEPQINDSLICFSNGLKQKFDCEIFYTSLNELPDNF